MRARSRRSGFMPIETVHLYLIVTVVSLAMAILFPILARIRERHRREQAVHLRR